VQKTSNSIEIVPAILSKTREDMAKKISLVKDYVNRIQIDIMDGIFVPNKTLDVGFFPSFPKDKIIEYHLMVQDPLTYFKQIYEKTKEIKSKNMVFELHFESFSKTGGRGGSEIKNKNLESELLNALDQIKNTGAKVGLAISPDTPITSVIPFLKYLDLVLVMTVYPGFSGQKYIYEMEKKISALSDLGIKVEVDGGIDSKTAKSAAKAGATLLCAASSIFSSKDIKSAIEELKTSAQINSLNK